MIRYSPSDYSIIDVDSIVLRQVHLFQVIYHKNLPNGSQPFEFNLGLVSSTLTSLARTHCPTIDGFDAKVDPVSVLSNQSAMTITDSLDGDGLVFSSFCLPENDNCTATLANSNITIALHVANGTMLSREPEEISVSYTNGRVFIYYQGFLQGLRLTMKCVRQSTNFDDESCNSKLYESCNTKLRHMITVDNCSWYYIVINRSSLGNILWYRTYS